MNRLIAIAATPLRRNHIEQRSTSASRTNHLRGARLKARRPKQRPAQKSSTSPAKIPTRHAITPTGKLIRPSAIITPAPMQVMSSVTSVDNAMKRKISNDDFPDVGVTNVLGTPLVCHNTIDSARRISNPMRPIRLYVEGCRLISLNNDLISQFQLQVIHKEIPLHAETRSHHSILLPGSGSRFVRLLDACRPNRLLVLED